MNDLFDLVGEIAPSVPVAEPAHVDVQRAALREAIRAERAREETPRDLPPDPGRRTGLGMLGHRRALLVGGIVASLAAILVLVLALVVVPGLGHPTSAAAAVLEEAAAVAGRLTTPGPGQFRYVETQSTYAVTVYGPGRTPGRFDEVATTTFGVTGQSWTDAAGKGQTRYAWGVVRFPPTRDQAVRNAMGPDFPGQLPTTGAPHAETPPVDVADLPTDPTQLSSVLAAGQLGTKQDIANGPNAAFERAARLLIGPTSGMTPALASALFRVMADQPGVRVLGTVTDHNGQQGVGVALSGAALTTTTRGPSEVIVDPQRGRLLEVDYAPPPATRAIGGGAHCRTVNGSADCTPPKGTAVLGPRWTDVVASGVVASRTATVPATGTATITATQVPGAPTHLVATVHNGAVDLSWDAPAPGAAPVTDYIVYRSGPKGSRGAMDTHSAATTYSWRALPSGRSVTFAVQAVNSLGYGLLSGSTTIMP